MFEFVETIEFNAAFGNSITFQLFSNECEMRNQVPFNDICIFGTLIIKYFNS